VSLFGKRRENPYAGLRRMVLQSGDARGVVMDVGVPAGSYTVVALADGTASLYTSTGGGVIGGGAHPAVVAAVRRLLDVAGSHLDALAPDVDDALPATGRVIIRVLTPAGRRRVEAAEDDLGEGRHPQSELFHAVHDVIGQLRIAETGGGS
jgi:hypothetical protein